MLSAIRDRAKGVFAWIIALALVVPLVTVGVYDYVAGTSPTEVATVNGKAISPDEVNRGYQAQRARLEQMFGGQLDASMFDERVMRKEVLDQLIDDAVLRQYVETHGFRLSNAALVGLIQSQDVFQENGRFSRDRYHELLRMNGLNPVEYEARVRLGEAIRHVELGVQGSDFVTDQQLNRLMSLQRQERELAYLTVDAQAFKDQVQVSDDEIKSHYEANIADYQRPEQVQLDYVVLDPAVVAESQVQITEDDLEVRYEQEKERFTEPETRQLRHILIQLPEDAGADAVAKAQEQLQQWRQQIQAGEADFAELAQAHSDDTGTAADGGDLGSVAQGEMVPAFEAAAFSLQEGALSEPVRTPFGLHLIQVTGIDPQVVTPFAEVKDTLREELQQERAENRMADLANRLANLAYENPDNLETVAKELGLTVQRTGWITAQGGSDGLAANPQVVTAAFSDEVLRQGRNSQPVDLAEGRQAVVRVAEHQPAEPLPLEEVSGRIQEQLRQQKLAQAAESLGNELQARAAQGEPLDALAESPAVSVNNPGFVGRSSDQVPPAVLRRAFQLPTPAEGEPSLGSVALPGGDYAVLRVSSVREGEAPENAEQVARQARDQLSALYGSASLQAFIDALRQEADVKIYEDRL